MSYQQIEKLEKSPNDRKRKKQMRTKKISAVMCMVVVLAVLLKCYTNVVTGVANKI